MAKKEAFVRVTNPSGVTSWVTAEQAEALLKQPGWKKAAAKEDPKKGADKDPKKEG
ncbi:hypothetical protein [Oceanithermus sp.]|uniref:hypothetical protein n=1 Tax=Oceanithermus sp. TaxID=2268145 RepID=UPI00257F850A|nr:hypothetical protein [Oceanithermus sp.]